MGKDSFRFEYDPVVALANAPKLLGMELKPNGTNKLCGAYYLTGEPHAFRRDKLKVTIWRGRVFLFEEGGGGMSLENWLIQYGGASDYLDAIKMINGQRQSLKWDGGYTHIKRQENMHISPDVLRGAKAYDISNSPLFRHMCTLFNEALVRKVWDDYCVTTNSKHATVFWYLNASGQICHDKICWYGEDGHRIKTLPMSRQYKKADGYTENPMFGSHLKGEIKGILESEKSCLYAACYYGGIWLGTGGKNNLRDVSDISLYPDRDAEESWMQHGNCVDWYSDWPECGEHSDLGDKIEWMILRNKR